MTVFPTEHGMTTAALVARIRYIGDHAADVCQRHRGTQRVEQLPRRRRTR